MLKFHQPGKRKVADLPPKEPQTQSAPEGGRKTMKTMIMMMEVLMKYNDDDIDDNDDNDDDDDDGDGNDFFLHFCRIILF